MKGGVKVYRGAAAAARHYVEADHARVDDYYLAEGTGLAERFVATPDGGVERVGVLDGDGYEAWVAGLDPSSLEPRGRPRRDANAVRFVEVVVNGPKSWSLAAALHPDVAEAYDAAMDRAAAQIVGWLAQHATTRVGPRGRQVQVPVERIEAVTVRHYTSRAGDPHRHLHLQVNARVFADRKWRGLHTVGVRDSIDAINGIGHAAVMTDPQFRTALAQHGFTLDPATGEVRQLGAFCGAFSARARQIGRNIEAYEAEWRDAHPGQEPGAKLRRAWDARAWAQARPDKVVPRDGGDLTGRWVRELHDLGYEDAASALPESFTKVGELDRDAASQTVLSRLGAGRSGWNAADIRGEAERLIAGSDVVAEEAARLELAEDLTARTIATCVPLLEQEGVPEHIRALTSREVLGVEADIVDRLAARPNAGPGRVPLLMTEDMDQSQLKVAARLAGHDSLIVAEGAAGAGKTTTLAAVRATLDLQGRRMVVVTPTLRAATVAGRQVGSRAFSAAWLAHQHGWRWDDDGHWDRVDSQPRTEATLNRGDLLLVDEAGMLDQDTARALLTIADEHGARVAFVGDRHQLPAVGRGGVLDLAARFADSEAVLMLDTVRRFADPEYADLSLAMRAGTEPGEVFDWLAERGHVLVHASETERTAALADEAAETRALVIADTREQIADLNAAIRERRVTTGQVDDRRALVTQAGERIGVGDRIATRHNDYHLGVANRDTWTVTGIDPDGTLRLVGEHGHRSLPHVYNSQHVELAYATTVYGAQGETTTAAHLILGEYTGAASAYVGMTRGRRANTAHLVAEDVDDARRQWIDTFSRDRADLGPAHAADHAAEEASKYATPRQGDPPAHERRPRPRQPTPQMSPPRDRGPGIGF
ncbi:MAG: MobF family relaxase [Actinomycetes bacterium]